MKEKYQTELLGALHETAVGLHKIGVISNEEMREYNKDCLSPDSESVRLTENPIKVDHISSVTA